MDLLTWVSPVYWLEVFMALCLFVPVLDTPKRNLALSISRSSTLPTLKWTMYILCLFLFLALVASWRELNTISGDGDVAALQLAYASRDYYLAFSTLLMLPLMGQYFYVMSEMRRLEKSDMALTKQAKQASTALLAKMDEVTKLEKTNKKLEELSFKKVAIQSNETSSGDTNEDKTTQLMQQMSVLKQKNKELNRSLEEKTQELSMIKERERSETRRLQQQQETLKKELEEYKMMLGKDKAL